VPAGLQAAVARADHENGQVVMRVAVAVGNAGPVQDQATIEHRGMAALQQVFTPAMARHEYKILAGVVGTASSGQDLLGGGGASVVKYLHESINGSQARIQAAVQQWSRIGYVNPQSGKQYWQVNRAIVLVDDALVQSQGGSWLVASRSWNYAPGQGP